MASEISARYAQGLFELAEETNTVEEKKGYCELLSDVLSQNPDIALLFRAVKITKSEKKEFIEKSFGSYVDHDMISFLKLIIDKGRSFYLAEILEGFVKLANEKLGIELGTVVSARALSEEDMKRIQDAVSAQSGNKVILKNKVDPSVIAGIKIIIGNKVTDITTKTKIEDMRNILLKGGQA